MTDAPLTHLRTLVDRLRSERRLSADGYKALLLCADAGVCEYLHEQARQVAVERFGQRIFIRGLIEISNACRNNCLYCGLRAMNRKLRRYTLSQSEILDCCRAGYRLGFRTFVLQSGEDKRGDNTWYVKLVEAIRREFPDCAITLSLGEKPPFLYRRLYQAGANRYLLRHETHNAAHYRQLHTAHMSQQHRLDCLVQLKEIGYQTGTGIMVGTPGQTVDHLVEDIEYIRAFRPEMIGIGPFIPPADTPFADQPAGSVGMTLKLLSLFRLMHPAALIPATTALATLAPNGRQQGILAGANVVMPNLSPPETRAQYAIYNNKASLGAESAEGLALLARELNDIGYRIAYERGDYQQEPSPCNNE
ncbi:MAG: [FeFe] hydrogenase H-cluster radical SAM maturase HydE [Prevotellaceae bacterium]|jgi:biotin synthase|nr:[FeFe] hydrogenase H-cluster radical SAM maturase HydE [Prevotellaceae bacterium]